MTSYEARFLRPLGAAALAAGMLHASTATAQLPVSGSRHYNNLAAGAGHQCMIGRSGQVYCTGDNVSGQIGDGTTTTRPSMTQVKLLGGGLLTGQTSIAAGADHTCSADGQGRVYCWGLNTKGQLGNGTYTNSSYATQVQTSSTTYLTGIVQVVTGFEFSCARDYTGKIYCWGDNLEGELGNNYTGNNSPYAAQVPGMLNAAGVTAGAYHACMRSSLDRVMCWGYGPDGEMGNGVFASSGTPTAVSGITNATQVAANAFGACARLADGTELCWGRNMEGQLGDGTLANSAVPISPSLVEGFITADIWDVQAIGVGGMAYHNCAILPAGGGTYCWGENTSGQIGDGTTASPLYVAVPNFPAPGNTSVGPTSAPITEIAMGYEHTCARTADGDLWCWGDNSVGQLGLGTTSSTPVLSPTLVPAPESLANQQRIFGGAYDACATLATGNVGCWGYNGFGEDGNNTTSQNDAPVTVSGLGGALYTVAGAFYACSVLAGGAVDCWGLNNDYQLGNGGTTNSSVPKLVFEVTGPLEDVAAMAPGCALTNRGNVYCWGENTNGQVGNGSTTVTPQPVPVSSLTNATALTGTDASHYCALQPGGFVMCWGYNGHGQLGNNSTTDSHVPIHVSGLNQVVAVTASLWTTCALRGDGTVWCWGYNAWGQLGNGSTTDSWVPVQVPGISDAVAVSTSGLATCAVHVGGTVSCWGYNQDGEVGDGTQTNRSSPTPVSGLGNVISVSLGSYTSYALDSAGNMWAWGNNAFGQFGNGGTMSSLTAVSTGVTP